MCVCVCVCVCVTTSNGNLTHTLTHSFTHTHTCTHTNQVHDHMKEDIKRAVYAVHSSQQHLRSKRRLAVEEEEDTSGTVFGAVTFPQAQKQSPKPLP